MRVKRGQLWSLVANRCGRLEIKVKSVRGPRVKATVVKTGVEIVLSRKTIERGLRGARLLSESGHPVKTTRLKLPPIAVAETRTASEVRKVTPPRGVQAVDATSEKMLRLYEEEHLTLGIIAQRMGVSRCTARNRVARARMARQDARHLAAVGA